MNEVQVRALTVGIVGQLLLNGEKKVSRQKLMEHLKTIENQTPVIEEALQTLLRYGILIEIADEFVLSERGRLLLNKAADKLAVAEITGDRDIALSKDEMDKICDANPNLPG